MTGYYITISNGLLRNSHRKRMGEAVWEFMWCLDHVTKIDDQGYGWVLGGKPIKLIDIAEGFENNDGEWNEGLGVTKITVNRNLAKLKREKYIETKRTHYGLIIKVCKAKKKFNKEKSENKEKININDNSRININDNFRNINDNSNKIVTDDSNSKDINPYGSEAQKFNKKFTDKLFADFKELTKQSPNDAPEDRGKLPRLIRQDCKKIGLEFGLEPMEIPRLAMSWALNLINKKTGIPYWQGKLMRLQQLRYKILPAYKVYLEENRGKQKLAEMKKSLFKNSFTPTAQSGIQVGQAKNGVVMAK